VWHRLLVHVLLLLTLAYALSPLVEMAGEILEGRLPVSYSYELAEVQPGRARIAILLTYTGPVPIRDYTLRVEPLCQGCKPGLASGAELKRGDTVRLEVEVAGAFSEAQVEFEGLVAGLYRLRASTRVRGGAGA